MNNNNYKYITIMTDSKFSLYSLNKMYYCDKEYYYNIVNNIFKLCKRMKMYNKNIRIVKIPAHSGFTGNELADYWAKYGAKKGKEIDGYNGYIRRNEIPLAVQIDMNNRKVKEQYLKDRERERIAKKRKAHDEGRLAVNSNLYQGVLRRGSKYVVKEKYFLTFYETAIISRLRSEHIELNLYNSVIFGNCDPNCDECELYETVRHFLIDCTKYSEQRLELRRKLIEINKCFKDDIWFTAKRLLFYHKYQGNPGKMENVLDRVRILKLVCSYVCMTKRFDDDSIKTDIYRRYKMDDEYNIKKKYEYLKDEINDLNKIDIIKMAEEKDDSFNIGHEVIDKREMMNNDYIKSIMDINKQIEIENENCDESEFFNDIPFKNDSDMNGDGDELFDFDFNLDVWESDSDISIESL